MNVEEIKNLNLAVAREKGFGVSLDEIDFAEKIALIHSEISETYLAFQQNNRTERHGVSEEMADIFFKVTSFICSI
jgi:hypothetical protein